MSRIRLLKLDLPFWTLGCLAEHVRACVCVVCVCVCVFNASCRNLSMATRTGLADHWSAARQPASAVHWHRGLGGLVGKVISCMNVIALRAARV